ncbi:MAG: hypothetical protein K5739_09735, partial [Lachnospiraceae bacterium]|nr:hypothetical protein [Lachnospiraceae bacterium]
MRRRNGLKTAAYILSFVLATESTIGGASLTEVFAKPAEKSAASVPAEDNIAKMPVEEEIESQEAVPETVPIAPADPMATNTLLYDQDGNLISGENYGYQPCAQDINAPAADPSLTPDLAEKMIHLDGEEAEESLSSESAFEDALPAAYPASNTNTTALQNYLKNNVMPTRNQNPYGSCWAHAAMASMELYRNRMQNVPLSTDDLSEYHLAHFTFGGGTTQIVSEQDTGDTYTFDGTKLSSDDKTRYGIQNASNMTTSEKDIVFLDRGGNANDSGHTLMHWKGAAAESDATYPRSSSRSDVISEPSGGWSAVEYKDAARMQNQYRINPQKNPDLVKRYIREYGGVQTSYYHADGGLKQTNKTTGEVIFDDTQGPGYFNTTYNSYNLPRAVGTNHAITLVGWDDNFPKENFNYPAQEDGAWLIRNSWSINSEARFSMYTYFWISYEDKSLKDTVFVFTTQEDKDRLDYNYYYDAVLHGSSGYPYNSTTAYQLAAANVFVASGSQSQECLRAVTIQETNTSAANAGYEDGGVPYEIRIYKGLKTTDEPDQGTLAYTQTGTLPFSGMYTINLDEGVMLDHEERYSVVVLLKDGRMTPDIEYGHTEKPAVITTTVGCGAEGQSYLGYFYTGGRSSWTDHKTRNYGNFCIGAQTIEIPKLSATKSGSNLKITWTKPAKAEGYELCSSTTKDGTYETIYMTIDPTVGYYQASLDTLKNKYYKIYRLTNGVRNEASVSEIVFFDENGSTPTKHMT